MSYLYVNEQGAVISFEGNRFIVKYKNDMVKSVPAELMEQISVFGAVQLTTQCMQECLKRGVDVIFYSEPICVHAIDYAKDKHAVYADNIIK